MTIAGQNGGQVAAHAQRVIAYERAGTHLRVTGACVSACALILALPPDRICVGPGARFGFHQPTRGATGRMAIEDIGTAIDEVCPPSCSSGSRRATAGSPPAGRST